MTAMAGSDVVQSGRPIFDDFSQHLWPYMDNNTANVVFQMVQNVKLDGHQTCLSINRLWHVLCDMLRRLVGTTAPGRHDCSIQE
ncbi:hypothetical protein TNCV_2766981 [Trichonephila clavipes]|nr:hypothetical protein TNCV_2766981 [Trichonephila clavipes]